MSQKYYRFVTDCVSLSAKDAQALNEMCDNGRAISYATFRRNVDEEELRRLFPQYNWGHQRGGLRLSKDWHVGYYLSRFKGRPCAYLVHSAIEYIFQE